MWTRAQLNSKLKATGIHLSISGLIFGVVLALILLRWYPGVWFADGGWQGVRIMFAVDMVLGPLLTFVIFNSNKSRRALAFDFTVIGLAQSLALVWGIHTVYSQRPVAIVYWEKAFYSTDARTLKEQNKSVTDLQAYDTRSPALIYAKPPTGEGIGEMVVLSFTRNLSEFEQVQLYRPMREHLPEIFAQHDALAAAIAQDPVANATWAKLQGKHPELKAETLRFAAFIGRFEEVTLVFTQDGELIGSLPKVIPAQSK